MQVADASNCEDAVKASLDTLLNYVQVFYAGIRLDLGHWTPNNVSAPSFILRLYIMDLSNRILYNL